MQHPLSKVSPGELDILRLELCKCRLKRKDINDNEYEIAHESAFSLRQPKYCHAGFNSGSLIKMAKAPEVRRKPYIGIVAIVIGADSIVEM